MEEYEDFNIYSKESVERMSEDEDEIDAWEECFMYGYLGAQGGMSL